VVGADVPCDHREVSQHQVQDAPGTLPAVVIEEGVAGVRVLLDVVIDPERLQGLVELLGGSAQVAILAAEAADDRAGSAQGGLGVRCHAVVHTRCREGASGGQQQGEPAAQAEADYPDPPAAVGLSGQPLAGGLDVGEGRTPTACTSRKVARRQAIFRPQEKRSGATAT
jgi:hypothetical protein